MARHDIDGNIYDDDIAAMPRLITDACRRYRYRCVFFIIAFAFFTPLFSFSERHACAILWRGRAYALFTREAAAKSKKSA